MSIRTSEIDDLILELSSKVPIQDKFDLSNRELMWLNNPHKLASRSLDEKLIIATKLKQRVFIVCINDGGIDEKEFSLLFRHTFLTESKNKLVSNLAHDKMFMVLGNETVSKYLHKAEMFLTSDMHNISNVVRKIKGNTSNAFSILESDKDFEIKEMYIHHLLRVFISSAHIKDYLRSMGMSEKGFLYLSILYICGKPLVGSMIANLYYRITGIKQSMRQQAINLHKRGYVTKFESGSTHEYKSDTRQFYSWALTDSGRDVVLQMVKKMAQLSTEPIG